MFHKKKPNNVGLLGIITLCFLGFSTVFFASCGTSKHLGKKEYLLRSNTVKLNTEKTLSDRGALKDGLKSVIVQKPNTYFLGAFPVKAWLYNLSYKRFEKDSTNFQIKSKIVEKPVVFNRSTLESSENQMRQLLLNQGFFNATLHSSLDTTKRKIRVTYTIDTKEEYLVDTSKFLVDSSVLKNRMLPIWEEKSLLRHSLPYSNALLSAERSQMMNLAKENGFYKFNSDNIRFELDTMTRRSLRSKKTLVENAATLFLGKFKFSRPTVSITTIVKEQEHYNAFALYNYRFIYVYPEYNASTDFQKSYRFQDTVNNIIYRYNRPFPIVKNSVIGSKIFLKKGSLFKQSDYNNTLLALNELTIFNYARIFLVENTPNLSSDTQQLDAYLVLNPGKTYEFNTNFELSGGDLYLAGSAVNASVINKNLFRRANQLSLSANFGFELNQTKNSNQRFFERFYLMSQNLGLNARLVFPYFVEPFGANIDKKTSTKTIFNVGVNVLDRSSYFRLRTINSSFGYSWKSSRWTTWQINPLFFNSLKLSNVSDSFQQRLDEVQAIRNSYQENFILGENAEFIHNTEGRLFSRHHFVRIGIEESGTLMRGANALSKGFGGNGLGFNYANYVRLDFDLRQYYNRAASVLALRFHGGVGLPYAESKTLPYIKQYFVGGAYSIRGWGPRLLGPGSYFNPALQNNQDKLFIDQSGDIKLETNIEYRFRMIQLFAGAIGLHGAVFADAGNIWITNKDPNLPGAEFAFNKVYQDIAVSAGAGLRADIGGFLILRADWAIPLKKPYISDNYGWVVNDFNFGSKQWRSENINLNIGIGLPF